MTSNCERTSDDQSLPSIFVSYSRKDTRFIDRLEKALTTRGFSPMIDREEIVAFEEWWKRIEELIIRADTIVFVLSPDAVSSDVWRKELEFSASLKKRFAPIVCRSVDIEAIPDELARLNLMFFDEAHFDERADVLAQALSTDIAWIRKHTEFGGLARRWSRAGQSDVRGLLLRPPVLEEAEGWIASRPHNAPLPTEVTQAFIAESRRLETRRRNVLVSSLGAGLVMALILTGVALWQRSIALEKTKIAVENESRALIGLSTVELNCEELIDAVKFILAAWPREGDSERPQMSRVINAISSPLLQHDERLRLLDFDGLVKSAAFSPEGTRIVTISNPIPFSFTSGTSIEARIWDVRMGTVLKELKGHSASVSSAVFSPDGARVVTASYDKTVRIWDASTGAVLKRLTGHEDAVMSAAFSPDGARVVTASKDKTARIWDASTGGVLKELGGGGTQRMSFPLPTAVTARAL